jgi:signal transduction histidine kinase
MSFRAWPVLALLALVVLAPTAVLTWLVGRAAENERLAARERVRQAHESSLLQAARELGDLFRSLARSADELAASHSGAALFGEAQKLRLGDAIVCLDEQGAIAYPTSKLTREVDLLAGVQAWSDAERLERAGQPVEAAEAFAEIAAAGQHPAVVARARLAQARCLAGGGDRAAAMNVLTTIWDGSSTPGDRDPMGRLVAVDAALLALLLTENEEYGKRPESHAEREELLKKLTAWGADYRLVMPSAQRRFLGGELEKRQAIDAASPWLAAERLASEIAEVGNPPLPAGDRWLAWRADDGHLIYGAVTPARKAIVLLRDTTLMSLSRQRLAELEQQQQVRFRLLPLGMAPAPGASVIELDNPPGWRLQLTDASENSSADAEAERRIALYGWATALTIAAVIVSAVLVGGVIGRQQRVGRQQNDWLASVSHELKTPLASIRLLTETLQDEEAVDRREYLRMIGQETTRLSRLIDGLLAFSRFERRGASIVRQRASPGKIAERGAQLLAERLNAPGCEFTLEVEKDLPEIEVDRDALIAVIVNLLDNALKFTPDRKRIQLAVSQSGSDISFAVSDNGIGVSRRDARRVFRRFFQVDRRLSREHQGCGLGLALARQIVRAHGGEATVESEIGKGSTFRVTLPITSPI